jgi:hypothetical protein
MSTRRGAFFDAAVGSSTNGAGDVIIPRASLADILAMDPATLRTEYIARPYVPRGGLIGIAGKGGVGKSKIMQDLCLARASGGQWLGLDVDPGPSLYWSGEQGKREDFRATQALCRGRGLARSGPHFFDIIYDPPLKFGHPTMLAAVMEIAGTHPGLFVSVDSYRRAFEGEDINSDVADLFFRTCLVPLRGAGCTVVVLAHPPKTSAAQKNIPDENMIRGSGDFFNQLDSVLVLRPITRSRTDDLTETIVSRLTHPKLRSGGTAEPRLVSLKVTADNTDLVALRFDAAKIVAADVEAEGAVLAAALLAEELKRFSRAALIKILGERQFGRRVVTAAIEKLLGLDVIRGPIDKTEHQKGERGHWYVFVHPLPVAKPPPETPGEAEEADDDLI